MKENLRTLYIILQVFFISREIADDPLLFLISCSWGEAEPAGLDEWKPRSGPSRFSPYSTPQTARFGSIQRCQAWVFQ